MEDAIVGALRWLAVVELGTQLACAQAPAPSLPPAASRGAETHIRSDSGNIATGRDALNAWLDAIASRFAAERAKTVAAIQTRADAEARQAIVQAKLKTLIGALPEHTPLNAKVLGETQAQGFRIRKVIYDSQPNFPVTALLYIPDGQTTASKRPAILMTPGHYPPGKGGDIRTAALFALNGFVVLSYDPIGQGERLQYPDPAQPGASLVPGATGEHAEASLQPMLLGDTFARYEIWDAMRGVDYLAGLSEVDPHRIGAFGCSGGGTVTALTSALDTRIAATGVACYITSFNALLPALGPQDAEQSSPRFLSSGLDFADLIEVAAPRPYAVISTYDDMFPFAGARGSVAEARRFYALFDPASGGTAPERALPATDAILTKPALNIDTNDEVSPAARLQFITGPGRHAALAPILGQILGFFLRNLEAGPNPDHPVLPDALVSPRAGTNMGLDGLPKEAFQVTPTGQVATSYPDAATVFALNRLRANKLLAARRPNLKREAVAASVRAAIASEAIPGAFKPNELQRNATGEFELPTADGLSLHCDLVRPEGAGRHPAVLFLVPDSTDAAGPIAQANRARLQSLANAGNLVLAVTPRPSPPGNEGMKAPVLGTFYLLSLRADLVGRTLLGMRVDDVIRAMDELAARPDVDPTRISAVASGHMGLVLLHAALLDARIRHGTVDRVLRSYRSLVDAPLPIGAPEDIVPGVLLRYDIPDLVQALGSRVEIHDALGGTDDLSQTATPIDSLREVRP